MHKHIYGKIGTLSYYYEYTDLNNIFSKNEEVIITPKYDGINFVTYYKNGHFKNCLTRGNGNIGKNISWAYKQMNHLTKELSESSFAINGEVIYLDDPNTTECFRNKVACYLSRKSKQINEKIIFMPFALLNTEFSNNYLEQLEQINKISTYKIIYRQFKELPSKEILSELFKEFKQQYQIDGLVITNTNKSKQVAYKFKEELR